VICPRARIGCNNEHTFSLLNTEVLMNGPDVVVDR